MLSGIIGQTKPKPGVVIDPAHPLSRGLVGCWLMNEGSGSRVADISGYGNHGTLVNMAPNTQGSGWGGGKSGGVLQFDGSNDHVRISTAGFKQTAGTVIAIINPKTISGGSDYIFCYHDGSGKVFLENESGNFRIGLGTSTIDTTADLLMNKSQQVGLTWSSNNYTAYYEGMPIQSSTFSGTPASTAEAWIGRWYAGSYNFKGAIDLLLYYNRALPAAEMKQLYHDPFCNLLRAPIRYVAAAPVGAIMNQFQKSNIGADLYNGALAI